jgi:hypothetical protein
MPAIRTQGLFHGISFAVRILESGDAGPLLALQAGMRFPTGGANSTVPFMVALACYRAN